MTGRWGVLALLFCVRMTMAVQFQAVAALSPLLMDAFGVGLADLGMLIGLYFAPGIAIAYPGGALGRRFGDRRVVMAGLALMAAGGTLALASSSWEAQIAGRLIAGAGGVTLNVLMSKMVGDWFAGREIATAMAIFVNSWPVGIALALIVLPPLAQAGGLGLASAAVVALPVLGFAALGMLYRVPPAAALQHRPAAAGRPGRATLAAVVTAGGVWGLYNAALALVFGFGPAMLAERGWGVSEAAAATSLVLWMVAVSVPAGGVLADRTGRRHAVLLFGLVAFAVLLAAATRSGPVLPVFALLGLAAGIPAGPIMSLPSDVLAPAGRAAGMGVFFTVFYVCTLAAPAAAGAVAEAAGSAAAAFDFGILLLAAAAGLQALFRLQQARLTRPDKVAIAELE